jgi:hypothetical protein
VGQALQDQEGPQALNDRDTGAEAAAIHQETKTRRALGRRVLSREMLSNSELNARSAVAVKVTTISIPIKRALAADSNSHVSIIASVVAPLATNALSAILATHLRHWLSEHVAGATESPGKRATGQEGRA